MSKQSKDQDEQQASSGEAQGGADAGTTQHPPQEGGKSGGSSSRRSRRRGKTSSGAASSSASQAAATSSDSGTAETSSASAVSSDEASSEPATKASGSKSSETGSSDTRTESSTRAGQSDSRSTTTTATSSGSTSTTTTSGGKASSNKASSSKAASNQGSSKSTAGKTGAAGAASGKSGTTGAGQSGGSGSGSGSGSDGTGKGKGSKAGVLALILVILLAIAVGVFGWLGWQRLQAQQQQLAEVPEQPATQQQVSELSSQLQSGQNDRESAVTSLREEFDSYRGKVDENLDRVLQQLSQQQQTDEREWLHAEAAYLLRLANQRLQLERDVEGSAALLRTADKRLKEADNPALMPVRREIASELAALRSVPSIDRTGLYLSLNALQEQMAGRPLAQDIEEVTGDASIEDAPSGGWREQLSKVGGELKDLVTVRQHDEPLEALISPEQESYLRQSVRLVMEQVQLALLKEEQELYDASLDKALTLIRGYYDTDDSGVQGVLSRLEELKGRQIRPELPDISGSQQALQTFIENRFETGGNGQGDEA